MSKPSTEFEKSSTVGSAEVVAEIRRLLRKHGVTYVNPRLFRDKSPAELANIKLRVQAVANRHTQ
jgi:hypothetical protein